MKNQTVLIYNQTPIINRKQYQLTLLTFEIKPDGTYNYKYIENRKVFAGCGKPVKIGSHGVFFDWPRFRPVPTFKIFVLEIKEETTLDI